jgi:hypothetical protein
VWRNKLWASGDPDRIFNAVRAVIAETGVVARKHRRVLDSTVLDDAVARQDTVTMLVTQIRRVRKFIPELERVWVREHNLTPGRPPCDWDDPTDVDRLISELVDDANELVWAADDDTETRHVHKTQRSYWDGYKAHVAVEPDTGLVTGCELTAGNTGTPKSRPGSSTANPPAPRCSATPPTAPASCATTCKTGT